MSLEATLLQEKEDWTEASKVLQELQQVYVHLKRVSSTNERAELLFKNLLSSIEPQLRLCAFHSGGVASFAAMTAKKKDSTKLDSVRFQHASAPLSLSPQHAGVTREEEKEKTEGGGGGGGGQERRSSSFFGITWRGEDLHAGGGGSVGTAGNEKVKWAILTAKKMIPQTVLLDDREMIKLLEEEEEGKEDKKPSSTPRSKRTEEKDGEEEAEQGEGEGREGDVEEKILSMLPSDRSKTAAAVVER